MKAQRKQYRGEGWSITPVYYGGYLVRVGYFYESCDTLDESLRWVRTMTKKYIQL